MSLTNASRFDLNAWIAHVQDNPDDLAARHELVDLLPQLLARSDITHSMFLYRFSRLHKSGSDRQVELLQKSAAKGNTHAMLELARQALEGDAPNLPEAKPYLRQIFSSNDSFMRHEATKLLEAHRQQTQRFQHNGTSTAKTGFFSGRAQAESEQYPTPKAESPVR